MAELHLNELTDDEHRFLSGSTALYEKMIHDHQVALGLARGVALFVYGQQLTSAQIYIQSSLSKEEFMAACEYAWDQGLQEEADRAKGKLNG